MAKPQPKPKAGAHKGAAARPAGRPMNRIIMILTAIAFIPFSLPTLVLLAVAMLPTAAAALVDRGPQRFAWLCVGGLNFAGASPFLFSLWFGPHTLDAALAMLTDVFALLVMYGSAGVGWLLYETSPPVVATFLQMTTARRLTALRQSQRRLMEQWGEGVTALGGPME